MGAKINKLRTAVGASSPVKLKVAMAVLRFWKIVVLENDISSNERGGGLMQFLIENILSQRVQSTNSTEFETCWLSTQ